MSCLLSSIAPLFNMRWQDLLYLSDTAKFSFIEQEDITNEVHASNHDRIINSRQWLWQIKIIWTANTLKNRWIIAAGYLVKRALKPILRLICSVTFTKIQFLYGLPLYLQPESSKLVVSQEIWICRVYIDLFQGLGDEISLCSRYYWFTYEKCFLCIPNVSARSKEGTKNEMQ